VVRGFSEESGYSTQARVVIELLARYRFVEARKQNPARQLRRAKCTWTPKEIRGQRGENTKKTETKTAQGKRLFGEDIKGASRSKKVEGGRTQSEGKRGNKL